mgnify:CR=1 FL=1
MGSHPRTLYAGTIDGGIYRSIDGAVTWHQHGWSNESIMSLAVDPTDSNKLYAGTTTGPSVSRDGGVTWSELDDVLRTKCPCHTVEGLAFDPTSSNVIYSTVAYGGVFVSRVRASSWSPMRGITTNSPKHILFDPRDPNNIFP